MKQILYVAGLCVLLAGCGPKAQTEAKGGAGTESPAAEQPAATNNEAGSPSPTTPENPPLVSQLPAELKHEGYEFYGLGHTEPVDLEVSSTPNGRVLTGSMTTKLISLNDGKAVFRRERTGSLEQLGVDEYSLEKDGIYVKSSTVAKTNGHQLEIPAKLNPGASWSDTTEIELNGQSLKMTNNYKVVGTQPVKTKKGSYDALLITTSGKGVVGGKNVRMDSKSWYVKGLGNVKTEIKMVDAQGQTQTVSYQITG
jgi:hypothetical protein